jgi:hypothetical protein
MYTARMPYRKAFNALVLAVICPVAVLVAPEASAADDDAAEVQRLRLEITQAIGEARCRNLVNCRVVGLGARPCGGPEEYVAYSIWDTDREHISNLVFEHNLLSEDLMLDSGGAGVCVQLPEPDIDCIHDRCVTVPGAS